MRHTSRSFARAVEASAQATIYCRDGLGKVWPCCSVAGAGVRSWTRWTFRTLAMLAAHGPVGIPSVAQPVMLLPPCLVRRAMRALTGPSVRGKLARPEVPT